MNSGYGRDDFRNSIIVFFFILSNQAYECLATSADNATTKLYVSYSTFSMCFRFYDCRLGKFGLTRDACPGLGLVMLLNTTTF